MRRSPTDNVDPMTMAGNAKFHCHSGIAQVRSLCQACALIAAKNPVVATQSSSPASGPARGRWRTMP